MRTPRDVILKSRQIGLTTIECARDIWFMLRYPGSKVTCVCQSLNDRGPLVSLGRMYNTMFSGLKDAGLGLTFGVESSTRWSIPEIDSVLEIIESGASQAAAAKKGRAGTIHRLHITECAFYEHADDTLLALEQCVPKPEYGSEIVNESTPNGVGNYFHTMCTAARDGTNGYALHFFPWFLDPDYQVSLNQGEVICPRSERERELVERLNILPEQLKWYQQLVAKYGQRKVDQEYPSDPDTCFLTSGAQFFEQEITAKLKRLRKPPVYHDSTTRIWQHPIKGHRYVIAADTAEGIEASQAKPGEERNSDFSAAVVYDRNGTHCATMRSRYMQPWQFARALKELGERYNGAMVVVERNNHGHAVLQALDREQGYRNIYRGYDRKLGWLTNQVTRPQCLDLLQDAHRREIWSTSDDILLSELGTFVVDPAGKAAASKGSHDDCVMAAAIGWIVICSAPAYRNLSSLP